jgi:hypothetical protein
MTTRWKAILVALVLVTVTALPALAPAEISVAVGDPFPDFTARDHADAPFQLSSQLGKVVLLHVCTLLCAPCQASANREAELTERLDAEIGAGNWLLVDVLLADQFGEPAGLTAANAWRSVTGTPALTVHGSGSPELAQFFLDLGLEFTPTYFVVAPEGTLSAIEVGFDDRTTHDRLATAVVAAWAPFRVARLCSVLGDDPSLLDQDIFEFVGSRDEEVTITLERDPAGTSTGDRATLLLVDAIRHLTLVRADRGAIPNQITVTLPAAGRYLVIVGGQPRFAPGKRFRGAYCLGLESSGSAQDTLAPHAWVE